MGGRRKIRKGDCLINLSSAAGIPWDKVWEHPENKALREKREHLNILHPGDELFIPEIEIGLKMCATEEVHEFRLKTKTVDFTLTILEMGKPRANEEYVLSIPDFGERQGTTDEKGALKELIPSKARNGVLFVGETRDRYDLHFGGVDPIETVSGVQTRLFNLGFYGGAVDDKFGPVTEAAIAKFQRVNELPVNGELNDETRQKLLEVHGG